jgi:hypothetical protein
MSAGQYGSNVRSAAMTSLASSGVKSTDTRSTALSFMPLRVRPPGVCGAGAGQFSASTSVSWRAPIHS